MGERLLNNGVKKTHDRGTGGRDGGVKSQMYWALQKEVSVVHNSA